MTGSTPFSGEAADVFADALRSKRAHSIFGLLERRRMRRILADFTDHVRTLVNGTTSDVVGAIHFDLLSRPARDGDIPFDAAVCVLAARRHHPGLPLIVYGNQVPTGRHWKLIESLVQFVECPPFLYSEVPLARHAEAYAELVKLIALHSVGGLALSADTLTLRNMAHLFDDPCTLAMLPVLTGSSPRLGTTIVCARAGSNFIASWMHAIVSQISDVGFVERRPGHDIALRQYLTSPHDVRMLPHDAWYFPLWNHINQFLFDENAAEPNLALVGHSYSLPLWRDVIGAELDNWNAEAIVQSKCLYAMLCREALASVPQGRQPSAANHPTEKRQMTTESG